MTIRLLERLHPDAEAVLTEAGTVLWPNDPPAPADAILTRGRGRVTAALMDASPNLKAIARAGVGVDNIDVAAATARAIPVVNAPGSTTLAVAEHTMLLMLTALRRADTLYRWVKTEAWEQRQHYQGQEAHGRTLGLVGMGDIAQRVAQLATAFGMRVQYANRSEKDVPYPRVPLDVLMQTSDVISLHVALTPATQALIGTDELATLKPAAVLLNTARGAVVDEAAVLAALEAGRLAVYASDVLVNEPPPPEHALVDHPGFIGTPHVGAVTQAAYRTMCLHVATQVASLLQFGAVDEGSVVNRERLY
ncbi:MAG: NAD(P)-dependent oxidoreductase [Bacteroidota bacterium]